MDLDLCLIHIAAIELHYMTHPEQFHRLYTVTL